MLSTMEATYTGFTPVFRLLPSPGTNGYITSWGAILSGTSPASISA